MQSVSLNSVLLNSLGGGMANVAQANAANGANLLAQTAGLDASAAGNGLPAGVAVMPQQGQVPAQGAKKFALGAETNPTVGNFMAAWLLAGQMAAEPVAAVPQNVQAPEASGQAVTPVANGVQVAAAPKGQVANPYTQWIPQAAAAAAPVQPQVPNTMTPAVAAVGVQVQMPSQPVATVNADATATPAAATPQVMASVVDQVPEVVQASPAAPAGAGTNASPAAELAGMLRQAQAEASGQPVANGLAKAPVTLERPAGEVTVTVPQVASVPVEVLATPVRQVAGKVVASPAAARTAAQSTIADASIITNSDLQSTVVESAGASVAKAAGDVGQLAGELNSDSTGVTQTAPDAMASTVATSTFVQQAQQVQPADAKRVEPAMVIGGDRITGQIASAFAQSGSPVGQQITIRLDPPELGMVKLRLHTDGGLVRGVVEVDNVRTLGEIQREAPALMHRLSAEGVQIKSMDVVLTPNASGDPSSNMQYQDRQTAANFWSQQGWGSERQQWSSESYPGGEAGTSALEAVAVGGGDSFVSDQAINIWI